MFSFRLTVQEIIDHTQAGGLAFLGVELRRHDIIAPDECHNFAPIVNRGKHFGGITTACSIGMHEIDKVAFVDAMRDA